MATSLQQATVDGFMLGAQAMREMLARFVEQGGDPVIAQSMRLNWSPSWGNDPGPLPGNVTILRFNGEGLQVLRDHIAAGDLSPEKHAEAVEQLAEGEHYMAHPIIAMTTTHLVADAEAD